jgi:hypothetical protein
MDCPLRCATRKPGHGCRRHAHDRLAAPDILGRVYEYLLSQFASRCPQSYASNTIVQ